MELKLQQSIGELPLTGEWACPREEEGIMGSFSVGRTGSETGGCGLTSTGKEDKGKMKTQMSISEKIRNFITSSRYKISFFLIPSFLCKARQGKTSKFLGATLFSCPIVCSSLSLFRVGKLNWIKCRTTNVCANLTVKCISVLGVMSQKRNKDNKRDKESVRYEEKNKKREELFFKYQRANAQQSCGRYQKVLCSLQSFLSPTVKK